MAKDIDKIAADKTAKTDENYKKQLDKAANQIKTLKYTKNYTEQEIKDKAHKLVELRAKLKELAIEDLFTDSLEKRRAKKLAGDYLTDFSLETVSDLNNLRQLIFLEIMNLRLQSKLNEDTDSVSRSALESIHKNLKEISNLKDALGIKKKEESINDPLAYFQTLKKKYKKWCEENQASRSLLCPHCVKPILLRIKIDEWEAQKHPFFQDRIFGNKHIIKLYKDKILTKEDVAKIFSTSQDTTEWLTTKWLDIPQQGDTQAKEA